MFNTGSRTIFDVSKDHIGHSISIRPLREEGVLCGVMYYCNDCFSIILRQETQDSQIREEIERRKATRLSALSFEEWEERHHGQMERSHADDCGCEDGYWDCQEGCGPYEGSELSQFYNEYLDSLANPQRQTRVRRENVGWETGSTGWET